MFILYQIINTVVSMFTLLRKAKNQILEPTQKQGTILVFIIEDGSRNCQKVVYVKREKEMKVICYKCGKEFEIHPDLEPHKIDNNSYCTECYYVILGDAVEKHPLGLFRVKLLPDNAKELQDQFDKDLKQLQENCKHQPSDWVEKYAFPMHSTGYKIKYCHICEKELECKAPCEACGKDFTFIKRDWTTSQLCQTCLEKGKYYCYTHKFLHSNRRGCPKCLKIFEGSNKQ